MSFNMEFYDEYKEKYASVGLKLSLDKPEITCSVILPSGNAHYFYNKGSVIQWLHGYREGLLAAKIKGFNNDEK